VQLPCPLCPLFCLIVCYHPASPLSLWSPDRCSGAIISCLGSRRRERNGRLTPKTHTQNWFVFNKCNFETAVTISPLQQASSNKRSSSQHSCRWKANPRLHGACLPTVAHQWCAAKAAAKLSHSPSEKGGHSHHA
jgi:hypothetical protein